jgi:hypothetical protein
MIPARPNLVYVGDTLTPWHPYVGKVQGTSMADLLPRLREHVGQNPSRAAYHTMQHGMKSLLYWEKVASHNQAEEREIEIRDELAFVLEPENCHASNGIEVWVVDGFLETNLERTTSLGAYSRFDYDKPIPRRWKKLREFWLDRFKNPISLASEWVVEEAQLPLLRVMQPFCLDCRGLIEDFDERVKWGSDVQCKECYEKMIARDGGWGDTITKHEHVFFNE